MANRVFQLSPATRQRVPLWVAFVGPSGTGKTYSALRLATGIESVQGGKIAVIDTESRRSLHYAPLPGERPNPAEGKFSFHHLPFSAPYSPDDYLAAIRHCVDNGATTIVIDSMSHEHESQGGLLEMQEEELQRLAGDDVEKRNKMNFTAWVRPKRAHNRMLQAMLSMPVNFLCCYRAKDKLEVRGRDTTQLGWMPIGSDDMVYEMMTRFLFVPGATKGQPEWRPEGKGSREVPKIPRQFTELFSRDAQITEEHGEAMAHWAEGGRQASDQDLEEILAEIDSASTRKQLNAIATRAKKIRWDEETRGQVADALSLARERINTPRDPSLDSSGYPAPGASG